MNQLIAELSDSQLDALMVYVPVYTEDNSRNIKRLFMQKAAASAGRESIYCERPSGVRSLGVQPISLQPIEPRLQGVRRFKLRILIIAAALCLVATVTVLAATPIGVLFFDTFINRAQQIETPAEYPIDYDILQFTNYTEISEFFDIRLDNDYMNNLKIQGEYTTSVVDGVTRRVINGSEPIGGYIMVRSQNDEPVWANVRSTFIIDELWFVTDITAVFGDNGRGQGNYYDDKELHRELQPYLPGLQEQVYISGVNNIEAHIYIKGMYADVKFMRNDISYSLLCNPLWSDAGYNEDEVLSIIMRYIDAFA